jgi:hypothetical protein
MWQRQLAHYRHLNNLCHRLSAKSLYYCLPLRSGLPLFAGGDGAELSGGAGGGVVQQQQQVLNLRAPTSSALALH